jgi:hypothetical protein
MHENKQKFIFNFPVAKPIICHILNETSNKKQEIQRFLYLFHHQHEISER